MINCQLNFGIWTWPLSPKFPTDICYQVWGKTFGVVYCTINFLTWWTLSCSSIDSVLCKGRIIHRFVSSA